MGLSREHATWHATLLAWPLAALLAIHSRDWDDPVLVAILLALLASFAIFVLAMLKVEAQLNKEGDSLVYPWRVPATRREVRRVDGVLATSIRRIVSGEDEAAVLSALRLQLEGVLKGEAGRHYARARERLLTASRRDWVFDAERREADLEAAVNELWRARAEYLKELI